MSLIQKEAFVAWSIFNPIDESKKSAALASVLSNSKNHLKDGPAPKIEGEEKSESNLSFLSKGWSHSFGMQAIVLILSGIQIAIKNGSRCDYHEIEIQ